MSLIPIEKGNCPLGVPLPWVVFDQDGNVFMEQGAILETEEQLQALLASNPLRELSWDSATAGSQAAGAEAAKLDAALAEESEGEFTFQDMRLKVGDRIQIQPPATVSHNRYVVKLIGYVDNVGLLVTSPMENGFRVPFRERDKIVARIFSSQKAFGFSTQIDRVCKIPFDYLHLSFPDRIQGSLIRSAPRVRTNIIASIAKPGADDGGERQSGLIVNLSADGALVKTRQALCEKGQSVQLSFRINLHNLDAYLTVTAVVRTTFADEIKPGSPAMINHGVQFQKLPPNDSVILQSKIYQQMIEQPHSLV